MERQEPRLRWLFGLTAVAIAARLCSLAGLHPVAWDEVEYFRATDWVSRGLVPYRNFWEHHTPLQWFVFAPFAALVRSPGNAAIIAMRCAQIPLWIASFALLATWMRRAGIERMVRWSVIVAALCSSMLMLAAVEYRVDALGVTLYLAGLVLLQRAGESDRRAAFAAGIVFCLAGFANIRLGPLLVLTMLVARVMRPQERRWRGNEVVNATFLGGIAAFAVTSLYFVATGSARLAFRRAFRENYLADRFSDAVPGVFINRITTTFGLRIRGPQSPAFELGAVDPASIAILLIGTYGVVRQLWRNRREPDDWFFLAAMQLCSILFIAAMKVVYHYHFEIVVMMMLPLVAFEVQRFVAGGERRMRLVAAALLLVSCVNVVASVFRGKEGDFAYQDLVMREVDRATPPDAKVFDGVGRALHRRPAYQYWFLAGIVRTLADEGLFERYDAPQAIADPPAAVITDINACVWIQGHPRLRAFFTRHYLATRRNLWLPGLSARLSPGANVAEWIVPADGDYRVVGSEALANHPWFRDALAYGSFDSPLAPLMPIELPRFGSAPVMTWTIDGMRVVKPDDVLHLRRMQRLRVEAPALREPLGLFLVPRRDRVLFQQPPTGVSLDGDTPPVTHLPDFRKLLPAR